MHDMPLLCIYVMLFFKHQFSENRAHVGMVCSANHVKMVESEKRVIIELGFVTLMKNYAQQKATKTCCDAIEVL